MENVLSIMDMLDWNMPPEIQAEGRSLAKNVVSIVPFLQPLTPKHNKNVWENCAIIISERNNESLEPYLLELLEWLQDMNWPGASLISERLSKMPKDILRFAYKVSLEKAVQTKDDCWKHNLLVFWNEG